MTMRPAPVLKEMERFEWRVLCALRPVDSVTGTVISENLQVEAPEARISRNRSGLWVVHEWATLAAHAEVFEAPPADPAIGSQTLNLTVRDPLQRYLPRQLAVALPRDPEADDASSLFEPIDVPMYPAPHASLGANWCAVRVVVSSGSGADELRLGGALLTLEWDGEIRARGITDWRGEALIAAAGVPITRPSADDSDVVTDVTPAVLRTRVDAALVTRFTTADVASGRQPEASQLPLADPDDLENRGGLLTQQQDISLTTRGRVQVNLVVDLP